MKRIYGIAVGDRSYGVGDIVELKSYDDGDDGVDGVDMGGNVVAVHTVFETDSDVKVLY